MYVLSLHLSLPLGFKALVVSVAFRSKNAVAIVLLDDSDSVDEDDPGGSL